MSTERAGLQTLWASFAKELAGAGRPLARANTLVEGWPVWMKGSKLRPALKVHAVSQAAEGMDPLRTSPLRVAWEVAGVGALMGTAGYVRLQSGVHRHGRCSQRTLRLLTWASGKLSTTHRKTRQGQKYLKILFIRAQGDR